MKFSHLCWFSMQVAVAPVFGTVRQLSSRTLPICVNEPPTTGFPTTNPTGGPTNSPTNNPTGTPTTDPTGSPTDIPTGVPTNSPTNDPTGVPTGSPTHDPTISPTTSPTNAPTDAPTSDPTRSPTSDPTDAFCATLTNLGDGFSAATGDPHYSEECYPVTTEFNGEFNGRDDSVSLFVGGNYIGQNARSIEGKVVVLGNLEVESNGPGLFVSSSHGSQVVPNSGGDCVIVGKHISADRGWVGVFNQVASTHCDIVYKSRSGRTEGWHTNGELRHEPNYDLTHYENMKYILAKKSQHWKTFPSTGMYIHYRNMHRLGTRFLCNIYDQVQVFNIDPSDHESFLTQTDFYQFDEGCEGKTILINVHGSGDLDMESAIMYDQWKYGPFSDGFSTCLTQNILWNFPDFASVTIGENVDKFGVEFHGSILVGGDLTFKSSGYSGRMLVLGDMIHDSVHLLSTLRSYPFAPPMPLPDPADVCELPTLPPTVSPTGSPTVSPTSQPEVSPGCIAIPQSELPRGVWATSDGNCAQCLGANAATWYPCNASPPICDGNRCIFSN